MWREDNIKIVAACEVVDWVQLADSFSQLPAWKLLPDRQRPLLVGTNVRAVIIRYHPHKNIQLCKFRIVQIIHTNENLYSIAFLSGLKTQKEGWNVVIS